MDSPYGLLSFLVSYAGEPKESFATVLAHPFTSIIQIILIPNLATYQCFSYGEEGIHPFLAVKYKWKKTIGLA